MLELKVNIVQLVNITAFINGLVFSVLLLVKRENKGANRFLALLLASLSITMMTMLILEFGLYNKFPALHWLPFTMTFWIGPSFYFYIKKLIEPAFKFRKIHFWHFSPIVFNYLHSVYHLIYGRNFPYPLFHNFTEAVGTYGLISMFIYLFLSYKSVKEYQKFILNQLSTTDDLELKWIKQLIKMLFTGFFFIAIFKIIDYKELIDFTRESYEGYFFEYRNFIQLIPALTIYWLGIGGHRQIQTIHSSNIANKNIDNRDYSSVIKKLLNTMEEHKLYLDSTLNLKGLSLESCLSEKEISIALNQKLNKNFYYFVNEYRVKEAEKRLSDPSYNHLKILSIAFDCGFNSKATFNRIFKESTGKSPKYYRDHMV